MTTPPTGTVTFLFTDIEGSTRLWEKNPDEMSAALARHDRILGHAVETNGGFVFKTVGDAFCCTFASASEALNAAIAAQYSLSTQAWPETLGPLRVRMALHTGDAEVRGGDYFGPPVNRVARLLSAGHGGQILLSLPVQSLVRDRLPEGIELRDMGERRLKDLVGAERIFELYAPDLPAGFPPLRTLDERLNNLPVQPTPIVGRELEIAKVCKRLRRPEVRLLTLTGPGGTGKTRLSLQAAADLLDEYESGAFFVALAPIRDPALVATTVARALGAAEGGDMPLEETLKEYLREKELLLVLDNFEQVLEASTLVGELLKSCPRLTVLATSRTVLNVYGEHEHRVPPLALPDLGRPLGAEAVGQYASVRLLVERAQAVSEGFQLTDENAETVAEICARLDGLPLAIELAAARTRLFDLPAMLTRLDNRLKLLKGGERDRPEHQRTLRSTIAWSHDLLSAEEQAVFRRLSVFVGSFTLDAAETVCEGVGSQELDALDGVEALLGKSLLSRQEATERFAMLETIREYALEMLEASGESEEARRTHLSLYSTLAESAEDRLKGPRQVEWIERLEAEHDNLRAAISWSLEHEEAETTLRLGGALGWFWWLRGHVSEGRRWLEVALKSTPSAAGVVRARALIGLGLLVEEQGDYGLARDLYEESLGLYREAASERGVATSLHRLGALAVVRGEHEEARTYLEESRARFRETGDRRGLGLALTSLAWLMEAEEDVDEATALLNEALSLSRELGDPSFVSLSLGNVGYMELVHGDRERAAGLFEESLALGRQLGSPESIAHASINLGLAVRSRGDVERAAELFEEGLATSLELGDRLSVAECLEGLAGVAGARGEARRAATLWGASEGIRALIGSPLLPADLAMHEPYLDAARTRMGEEAFEAARERGRTTRIEETLQLVSGVGQDSSHRDT